ncbi:hypothetical protein CPB83DRAFT_847002 [Crepidotus variabilis]|uniref:DnaJ-domain-containing protein n=1 Tax=Crepidotus variabilis TaxID=179855 RepID=A0A9P6JT12_9AGAR|nr:hypothetical protein CPB83DRAFT_847002 [Crepidotus variabilis]
MPAETELYELLGVSPNASDDDIKKAYKRKAKEHHPDKNINDPEAGQKFQEIAAAYEILSDPNTRTVYDQSGMDGLTGGGRGSGGMDAEDIFAHFFGGGGGNPMFGFDFGPSSRRGKDDSVITYDVTLEDLYNGKSVKMNMEKDVICGLCKGSGAKGNAKPKQCSTCDGKGWTPTKSRVAPGTFATSRGQCPDCKGEGQRLKEKERCKKCKGDKVVKEKTRQEIFIEKGMTDRQRIVLAGAGDQQPDIPPGDVIFVLKAAPHASFERNGNDLLSRVTLTLSEALLGFSRIILTHLDGRGVKFTSKPGKIIKPGDTIILKNEGMPIHKRPDEKGSLFVLFDVEMPTTDWWKTIDSQALEALLPPKRVDVDPQPEIVDEPDYEETDILEFGEDEDDWADDDDDDDHEGEEPECRPQ